MNRLVIAGGTGFIGAALRAFLTARGYECLVLTRRPTEAFHRCWEDIGPKDFQDARAVVNLAGRRVDCVHHAQNKREIIESRVNAIEALERAILALDPPRRPAAFVQASSLAIYGDTRNVCDEGAPHGTGFPVEFCEAVERAFFKSEIEGVRKCLLRIGYVLGPGGGFLAPLFRLARLGLGGQAGSGRQFVSWIHIEDLARMFLACIENDSFSGVYNATGPAPVTNREFMSALRAATGRGWSPPLPGILVKLGAKFVTRTEPGYLLEGRNCVPKRFLDCGFEFRHADPAEALRAAL